MTTRLEPSIPEFFAGKTIFITGATGFLGKALIEKFLRNCPDIGDIYILVRPKKGKHVQERVLTLANDPVFERVKREQPNLAIEKKIIALPGDCKELNLGLSPEDRNTLIEKVNIIFHVAASVRLNNPLSEAIIMNVRGTREACELALEAKNIMTFIHVSTAFVNVDRKESKEIIYPSKLDWKKSIEIAEEMNQNFIDIFTTKITDGFPNTYTFTKRIAEYVVKDMLEGKVPCKIYRPSIVTAAMHDEPVKGWIDNLNGPIGMGVACGVGVLRTAYFEAKSSPDFIPIDVVTKSLIVCTWDLAIRSSHSNITLEVMNGTSSNSGWLKINNEETYSIWAEVMKIVPFNDILWTPCFHHTSNWYWWYIRTMITMVLPSILIDLLEKIRGKKPRLLKFQRRIYTAQILLSPVSCAQFKFHNNSFLALRNRIQAKDKACFDYEFEHFDAKEFIFNTLLGQRRYILNMPDSTIESAKKHFNKMQRIHQSVYTIFWVILLYLILNFWFFTYLRQLF